MKIGLIGRGAIAQYVEKQLEKRGHSVGAYLVRPEHIAENGSIDDAGPVLASRVKDLPNDLDKVVDCAGHEALSAYGPDILLAGLDLTTVSLGALADPNLETSLRRASETGGGRLCLVSGAIGSLDALRSARVGTLKRVCYVGRKPPIGWQGSPAEYKLDLNAMKKRPEMHFQGTAREAAQNYPKNANVAAAVALAGIGFDETEAKLIADPTIPENIHEILAEGEFGSFEFKISGRPLATNPKSSALAAMSVVASVVESTNTIHF
jgi:aspartate dehydrogenase